MNFTKEEISLCKQIAEKHRKKVGHGDWYLLNKALVLSVFPVSNEKDFYSVRVIPLWTISDCLEFFEKKGFQTFLIMELAKGWGCDGYLGNKIYSGEGNTILEACLKAVLAVLEEK